MGDLGEEYKGGNGIVCEFKKPAKERSVFFKITKDKKWVTQAEFENDVVAFKINYQTKVTLEKVSWDAWSLERRNLRLKFLSDYKYATCKVVTISELQTLATEYLKNKLNENKI